MTIKVKYKSWLPRLFGSTGVTFGHTVYIKGWTCTADLLAHESVHVQQYARYGWFGFLRRYLWELVRHGYAKNAFELAALAAIPSRVGSWKQAASEQARYRYKWLLVEITETGTVIGWSGLV